MNRILRWFVAPALFLSFVYSGAGQDNDVNGYNVVLSTEISPQEIPLNRTAELVISITWSGKMNRIEIQETEQPVLTNFEIVGTSSGNRVSGTSRGQESVKEIIYKLQPKTPGMAYVESMGISYRDIKNDEIHHLKTERVGAKVVMPVAEPGEMNLTWLWIVIGSVLVITGLSVLLILKKRSAGRSETGQPQPICEEAYLEELKNEVNLKGSNRREAFTVLTKLFRKYLSEKYELSAMEVTTADLIHNIEEKLEESLARKCETLFVKADLVKFSGQEATQAELDEAYTTVETVLEANLTAEKQQRLEAETKKKKHLKLLHSK